MKTSFEHKFNIGDIVYSTRFQRIEELEISGIAFDLFIDNDGNEEVRQNVSYRTDDDFHVNEKDLFATREAAETHLGIGTRANLEHQIGIAEALIKSRIDFIKECREKLEKLS